MRFLIALLVISFSMLQVGCTRSGQAESETLKIDHRIEIEVAPVRRDRITTTVETIGTLLPIRATTIVSEVDGVISRLPDAAAKIELDVNGRMQTESLGLDIGSMVREGDILVELDPTDAELALKNAEAQLHLVQATLEELQSWKRDEEVQQARATVDRLQAAWDLANAELQRIDRLMSNHAVSAGQQDTARAAERQAAAALEQARAALALAEDGPTKEQLAVARAQLEAAEVEVDRKRRELTKTVIRSPYDAVITDRFIDIGDRVTAMPRVEIMQIVDPRILFAEIDVPEQYVAHVRVGDKAQIFTSGKAQPLSGEVKLINGRIDLETRTFRTRIAIDNRAGHFRPGGLVRVLLPVSSQSDALLVPRRSVAFAEGQPSVFVYQTGGIVQRRPVELGVTNADVCQILSGVQADELIAVSDPALLADGLTVRLRSPAAAGRDVNRNATDVGDRK